MNYNTSVRTFSALIHQQVNSRITKMTKTLTDAPDLWEAKSHICGILIKACICHLKHALLNALKLKLRIAVLILLRF